MRFLPMMVVAGLLAPVAARADVDIRFSGVRSDCNGCYSESFELLLPTPVVPDSFDSESFTLNNPTYVERPSPFVVDAVFYRSGLTLFDPYAAGNPDPAVQVGLDGGGPLFGGPFSAPVFTPEVFYVTAYEPDTYATFDGTLTITDESPTATPEPGTWSLVGTGLFGLFGAIRRRLE